MSVDEGSGRENMVLFAVQVVPAGSKLPAAISLRISPRVKGAALVPQRLFLPKCHPYEGEREVQLSCRSWSNLSG